MSPLCSKLIRFIFNCGLCDDENDDDKEIIIKTKTQNKKQKEENKEIYHLDVPIIMVWTANSLATNTLNALNAPLRIFAMISSISVMHPP